MKLIGPVLALALSCVPAHAVSLEEARSAAGELRGLGIQQAAALPAPQTPAAAPVGRPELAVRSGHSYTAVFSTKGEADAALKRMVDTLVNQGALVLNKRVMGADGSYVVIVEYALQPSLGQFRYVSHDYADRYTAAQSLYECMDSLKKANITYLSYNVYKVAGSPDRYYFALGLLKAWETNAREYRDSGYGDEGLAWRSLNETVANLQKAGIPVLAYFPEKGADGTPGFHIDFLKNYQNEVREYALTGLKDAGEARRSMDESVANLAKAGVTVLSYRAQKDSYKLAFLIPDQRAVGVYDSRPWSTAWEARSTMDEALKDLAKAGLVVVGYGVSTAGEGYKFQVAFLGEAYQKTRSYRSETFEFLYEARQEMDEVVGRMRGLGLVVMSYRVEGDAGTFFFAVDYLGRRGYSLAD
ncbi:MAG: hypothetical protein HY926_15530 [Elusimicrobia bacterium]|nr:hypothetical protein [Elusimicrobiota bacterium]